MHYSLPSIHRFIVVIMALACTTTASAQTQDLDARLRAAYLSAYNLDHDDAVRQLEEAVRLAPEASTPHRALAGILWLKILFDRGTVLADEYLGQVSRRDVDLGPATGPTATAFDTHLQAAITTAEARLARNPTDPRAIYELSSAVALQASWAASVEGRIRRAFGSARRAYQLAERASKASPDAPEPRLILGTYRYVVSGLALPARVVAYVAGMDGGREEGLSLVASAAASDSAVQTEARFALVLLYNRERRWDDALGVLAQLRASYPRNRLLWLESGATALRAGRLREAERWLDEGLAMTTRDTRRRMFGEEAMWRLTRAEVRRRLGRHVDAREDLLAALAAPQAREWVRGRAHLEFAEVSSALNDREQARWQIDKAMPLLERGRDQVGLRRAKQLLEQLRRG